MYLHIVKFRSKGDGENEKGGGEGENGDDSDVVAGDDDVGDDDVGDDLGGDVGDGDRDGSNWRVGGERGEWR